MDFCDKHNMVAFLQKSTGSEEFHQITATVEIVNNGQQQITITVDGQTIVITEASVRRYLQLADADGISSLPTTEIFEQLTLMGYVSNNDKLTFQKGGYAPGSDEGSKKLNELTELYTKLFDKLTSLEQDLKQTKKVYGKALTKLMKKVKHLEDKLKSTTERRKARMVIFDAEEDLVLEDPSKQGRMPKTKYEEVEYELDQTDTLHQITPTKVPQGEEQSQKSSEVQLDVLSTAKILADASRERVKTYKSYTRRRSTDSSRDSTAGVQERQSDTIKRYQTLKKKPVSVAQARKNMIIYLKNMAGYKMGYFKGMSYDVIRPIFEEEYNKIQTLFEKYTKVEKTKTKRVAEETLLQENLSEEELKKMLEIVPVEETKAEALQVKYPIIDWEIHTEGSRKYWKIIRVRNITEAYQGFEDMLKIFDREDLVTLWILVKERFRSAEPTEDMEKALWVELKRLFEPDKDDVLWKQRYMHDPLTWRLYGSCRVHHVSSTRGHDIYMLTEKDYPLSTAVMGLMLSKRLQVEEDSEMARDLEAIDEEACLEEQILTLMHRFANRFTDRRPEINRINSLPDHPLIEHGRYTLGCITGADMKKATYLKMVRDELLRSMEEKS
ncbi:hypothetical protein Tco_0704865 [Tanacetum coccineum]|uniref:Uncharacterized protein n=1 Tax=Tanacetum coccineum TaxID=301880 RepID=A0ABQ4Y2X4_9ASTR